MQILGVVLLIYLARYIFSRNSTGGGPSVANNPPAKLFLVFLPLYQLAAIMLISGFGLPLLFNTLLFIVCFPSWIAQLSIKFGFVKTSYFLGRMALAIHTRDNFGGALFYGWRALQKAKLEKYQELESWLENKILNHKPVLRSGAMVIHVLLKRDRLSDEEVMELLRLLNGCNKQLIPGNISRYACRFMLARDFPTGNWRTINATAGQWQGVAINPLATWVQEAYWNRKSVAYKPSRIGLWFKYILAGMPKVAKHLPQQETINIAPSLVQPPISFMDLKLAEWWHLQNPQEDTTQLDKEWQKYTLSPDMKNWRTRLQELGNFNPDEGFQTICQSLSDVMSLRSGEAMDSDLASEEKDRAFTLLQIKINAVNQRLYKKQIMNGVHELEEWFAIAALAKKLSTDPVSESQAYYIMRSPCWNWVVSLWNDNNQKPLGFLISSFLSPYAARAADNEGSEFFSGIISNKFK